MRENPDTSLKLLRLLADEPHYPSRLTSEGISRKLGLTDEETALHLKFCVDSDLMEADIQVGRTLGAAPPTIHVIRILWLTPTGQRFVQDADAADGKFWKKAKETCAKMGIEASTSTMAEVLSPLVRAALVGEA